MIDSALLAVVQQHFSKAQLLRFEPLAGGVSAQVCRLDLNEADGTARSVVVRIMGKSGLESAKEYALLQELKRAGIAVPQVLFFDQSLKHVNKPYLIMEFVEGTGAILAGHVEDYLGRMARALLGIHQVSTYSFPELPTRLDPSDGILDWLPPDEEWEPLRAYYASHRSTPYEGVSVMLHGDFWPQNLIWQDGDIAAILDWEDAAIGDPLSDVACVILELSYLFSDKDVRIFTSTYKRHTPVDERRLALWQIYVAAAAYHFMGNWGLEPNKEAHMKSVALSQMRQAAALVLTSVAS